MTPEERLSKSFTTAPPVRDGEVVPQGTPDKDDMSESGPLAVPTRRNAETSEVENGG